MRRQNAVLIGGSGPAHQFQRSQIGRDKAQSGDPGRHLAPGHEELLAGIRGALQVKADEDDDAEVDRDDQDVDGVEAGQRLTGPLSSEARASCESVVSGMMSEPGGQLSCP